MRSIAWVIVNKASLVPCAWNSTQFLSRPVWLVINLKNSFLAKIKQRTVLNKIEQSKHIYNTFRWHATFLFFVYFFNSLSANPRKWSNTLKQFVDSLPTNCLIVFEHFVGLALKEVKQFLFNKNFLAIA